MKTASKCSALLVLLVLLACGAGVWAQSASAPPVSKWNEEIKLEAVDSTVGQIVKQLLGQAGISYTMDPGIEFLQVPRLTLKDVQRSSALKVLVKTCGLTYRIDGALVMISPKDGLQNAWLQHVTLQAKDTNLGLAVSALMRGVPLNYTVTPEAANLPVASVDMAEKPLAQVLDTLVNAAGAKYVVRQGVVIIMPKTAAAPNEVQPGVRVARGAKNGDPWLSRVSISASNALLSGVIEELLTGAGFSYAIDTYAAHLDVGSIDLADVSLREALNAVVKSAGATYLYNAEGQVITISAKSQPAAKLDSVTIEVKEAGLAEVMEKLFRGLGPDIRYSLEGGLEKLRVTASVSGVPLESALDAICAAAGLTYRISGNTYLISSVRPVTTRATEDKCTEEITLKNATADYIMLVLGLRPDRQGQPADPIGAPRVAAEGAADERTAASAARSTLIPPGITSVTPGQSDKTLIVTGTRKAVSELKTTIEKLDVEPKRVTVKVEYYQLDADNKVVEFEDICLGLNGIGYNAGYAEKLLEKLKAADIKSLNSPVICTLDRVAADIIVQTAIPEPGAKEAGRTAKYSISVTPTVNEDGTISTQLVTSFSDCVWNKDRKCYEPRTQSLSTTRRAPSGKPILAGFFAREDVLTVIFITATASD